MLASGSRIWSRRFVRRCGRIIDDRGVHYNSRNLSGLQAINLSSTAAELFEYLLRLQWMSVGIPDFISHTTPLKEELEESYEKSGRRTRKLIQRIPLASFSWGTTHEGIFRTCKTICMTC